VTSLVDGADGANTAVVGSATAAELDGGLAASDPVVLGIGDVGSDGSVSDLTRGTSLPCRREVIATATQTTTARTVSIKAIRRFGPGLDTDASVC
jgi:hypothetical protein